MSYMSPSYVLQRDFDEKWTSLSKRYSLWLYREVGWEDGKLPGGVPVIFIPGNAGASGQVRSIASSATRQYFSRPGVVAQEFEAGRKRGVKPLDFFALEFNEDLSAFHGPTLESQIRYTQDAISYILSLYPAHSQVIVLGHSMGGIVATALLPSPNISAIITMSTPHTLPPARFDARIDEIYTRAQRVLGSDPTPIVSLCGGATDMMIPSESCVLPQVEGNVDRDGPYRRTVFTSALEGAWTGVGHREMVWCHQVRWRVARAALELGALYEQSSRTEVLDTWLRDGHTLPVSTRVDNGPLLLENTHDYEVLPEATDLVLKNPHGGAKTYLLPYTSGNLVLYVSGGSVGGVSPYTSTPLQVSVYTCHRISQDTADAIVSCDPLKPTTLKLIPNPVPGKSFPVPREGADESEGVVLYESDIKDRSDKQDKWVGIKIEHADGRGWVVAGFAPPIALVNKIGTASLALYGTQVMIPRDAGLLKTSIELPNLLSNVLTVYRISPILSGGEGTTECTGGSFV
ncbi:hypothetical protein ONZ45_g6816 [Pleurotus djamor]|nr:hypothetical protein ONZ45_g6816 [Pleurotus djamor]